MSLAAFALRTATVMSLKGSTFADDRVYEAAIDPINFLVQEQRQPFIIVSTEDEEADVEGRDLNLPARKLALLIEIGLATRVETGAIEIPHTDAGLEAALNLMHRQVMRVFLASEGAWPDVLKDLTVRIDKIVSRRMADAPEKGAKYAARQIVLSVDTLAEPDFGVEPDPDNAWGRLLAAMETDPDLSGFAPLVREQIVGETLTPWRLVEAQLGLTRSGVAAIGLAPLVTEDDDVVPVTEILVDAVPDPDMVLTEASADEQGQ